MKIRGFVGSCLIVLSSIIMAGSAKIEDNTTYAKEIKTIENKVEPLVIEVNNDSRREIFSGIKEIPIEEPKEEVQEEIIEPVDLSEFEDIMPTMNDNVKRITNDIGPMYNIDPKLLQAIIFYESSNIPTASNGDCFGYMQVSSRWHQDRMARLGVTDLFDPYGNILVGTDILAELLERKGDLSLSLMLYNGDSRAYDLYNSGQMSEYANKIITLQQRLTDYENRGGK